MSILRRFRRYLQAQRLVPAWLPASERELRRWDALGEAYAALLEIASDANPITRQQMKAVARTAVHRVKESCAR